MDRGGPQTSQARTRKALFTVTAILVCVVALGMAAGRGLSEESAACEQYGCADAPNQTQTRFTEDTGGPHSGSAPASAPTGAPASASATASAVATGTDSTGEPNTPSTSGSVASASASSSASATSAEETPTEGSDHTVRVPSEDVADRGKSNGYDGIGQLSSEEQSPSTRPIEVYPYGGKRCDDRYCRIEGVEESVKCAIYKTATDQEVYGCVSSDTYEKKDCYEVTFYTLAREPYNNMDTCSGEKVYAPPEPPEGTFQYWEPPNDPQHPPDIYGHAVEHCQVDGPYSPRDPQCGLHGIVPKSYECNVYYDTAHGTVRGCAPARLLNDYYHDYPDSCADEGLHLYDEVGGEIGTANLCPKITMEECNTARCGQPVPPDWSCRTEHWNFGELYEGERQTLTRCADPLLERWRNEELSARECNGQLLGIVYDENGKKLDTFHCWLSGGGGGDAGEWAGFAADGADEALNGRDSGDGADDHSKATGVALEWISEARDTVFSERKISQSAEFFGALMRRIEGPPEEAKEVEDNSVRLTGGSSASQGGRAETSVEASMAESFRETPQDSPVRNAEVRAEDVEAAQTERANNGVGVQRKARHWQSVAVPGPLDEYGVGINMGQGRTRPETATSATGKAVSSAFQFEINVSRASGHATPQDDNTEAGVDRVDDNALTPVLGASLGRSPSAVVRGARAISNSGWAKTALATLGIVGGILVFRRRMAG